MSILNSLSTKLSCTPGRSYTHLILILLCTYTYTFHFVFHYMPLTLGKHKNALLSKQKSAKFSNFTKLHHFRWVSMGQFSMSSVFSLKCGINVYSKDISNSLPVSLVCLLLQQGNTRQEEQDGHGEERGEHCSPLAVTQDTGANDEDSKPQSDLPKVVRMSWHLPKAWNTAIMY